MSNDELLSAKEAGERLHVSPRTVRRWAKSGEFPAAFKAPGTRGVYLFDAAAVDRLAVACTEKQSA